MLKLMFLQLFSDDNLPYGFLTDDLPKSGKYYLFY